MSTSVLNSCFLWHSCSGRSLNEICCHHDVVILTSSSCFSTLTRVCLIFAFLYFDTDIIFCIYVYQRWIYRVDPKRVNEFGTSGDMLEDPNTAENPSLVNGVAAIENKPEEKEMDIPKAPPNKKPSSKSKSAKKRD